MRARSALLAVFVCFALSSSATLADSVLIRGGGILSPNNVNTFYNSQTGVTSSVKNTVDVGKSSWVIVRTASCTDVVA